jgi:hypothetical protein
LKSHHIRVLPGVSYVKLNEEQEMGQKHTLMEILSIICRKYVKNMMGKICQSTLRSNLLSSIVRVPKEQSSGESSLSFSSFFLSMINIIKYLAKGSGFQFKVMVSMQAGMASHNEHFINGTGKL